MKKSWARPALFASFGEMARAFHHPSAKEISIDGVLYALSDPVRRAIVHRLAKEPTGLNCAEACAKLPASTISFHYKVLREAGLIRSEKKGIEVISTVRKDELDRIFPGLLDTIFQHHRRKS